MKKKLSNENLVKDKIKAREIIQVVLDHGVNQNQISHMIYLLALELEDVKKMKATTSIFSEKEEKSSLITGE